jgi:hypothetical protein
MSSPCLSPITIESEKDSINQRPREEDNLKNSRMIFVDQLIDAFNLGETLSLESITKEKLDTKVMMKFIHSQSEFQGRNSLLLMSMFTQETFPDGLWKVLEKRYICSTVPKGKVNDFSTKQLSPKVEFVYKFSGIRILPASVNQSMKLFTSQYPSYNDFCLEDLSKKVMDCISHMDCSVESEKTNNYIAEGLITFAADSCLVTEITWNVLAREEH